MSAWDEGRPIFKRLPQYGWQDNEVVDQITSAYDLVLIEIQQAILNFPRDFIDPDTCRADALDWLGQLSGYTGEYWDSAWSEAVKRQLIKDAQPVVWRYKGSFYLLDYLFDSFSLSVRIRLRGQWRIGVSKVGDPIGGGLLVYSLVLGSATDPGYPRNSEQWRLIERLNRLYMPCWCSPVTLNGNFLHYHRWRIGRSMVGDPI
jgi:phage tail P2-like protein